MKWIENRFYLGQCRHCGHRQFVHRKTPVFERSDPEQNNGNGRRVAVSPRLHQQTTTPLTTLLTTPDSSPKTVSKRRPVVTPQTFRPARVRLWVCPRTQGDCTGAGSHIDVDGGRRRSPPLRPQPITRTPASSRRSPTLSPLKREE